jgi:hypothetical protein
MAKSVTMGSRGISAFYAVVLTACVLVGAPFGVGAGAVSTGGAGDVTVIAVIDSGFSPYHWDYSAAHMPQALNRDRSDDLPLSRPPDTWIKGFPPRSAFTGYRPMTLSLEDRDGYVEQAALHAKDKAAWDAITPSGPAGVNYYWMPGTKVVGAISFGPESPDAKAFYAVKDNPYYGNYVPIYGNFGPADHGMGSASVAVGNEHGACPECVLVFLQYSDDASANRAVDWAMNQPWIDAITNSYACDTVPATGTVRDGVCLGANTALQRTASTRGQTIFWAAGNGTDSNFVVPHQTLLSSQKGPDWIVTVTGTTVDGTAPYTGAGRPADVASIAQAYPSAFQSRELTGGLQFSGTSNATPVVAGIYGRALYLARRRLAGPSKVQAAGTVAVGGGGCAATWRSCPLADRRLTATELRTRLLQGAPHRMSAESLGAVTRLPRSTPDSVFAAEGHGTYMGAVLYDGRARAAEFDRVLGPLLGTSTPPARPAGERDWMVVDSWCRQRIWGAWDGGYYTPGKTALPSPDPVTSPVLSAYLKECSAVAVPLGGA